jgi:Transposase DDE domain
MYISFLLSEPKYVSCRRLGEVMNISHDSVNRFLNRESYDGKDLFNEVKPLLNLCGGTLSIDDSVLDKPYAKYIAFIGYFWSGKHHASVQGINLITMYYTDTEGNHYPVNFRVVDKSENKTKNDYFLEMLAELLAWGLKPAMVTGDSWYSCTKNLKVIKNNDLGFMFAIKSNRTVSIEKGIWQQVQSLEIPENGLVVWLKGYGNVKLFRTQLKNQLRHYVVYLPNEEKLAEFNQAVFDVEHDKHWQIEQYHRAIKQVCNIENFQVRGKQATKNHLFAAIYGFVQLQRLTTIQAITDCYQVRRELFKKVVSSFISECVFATNSLNPLFVPVVNA